MGQRIGGFGDFQEGCCIAVTSPPGNTPKVLTITKIRDTAAVEPRRGAPTCPPPPFPPSPDTLTLQNARFSSSRIGNAKPRTRGRLAGDPNEHECIPKGVGGRKKQKWCASVVSGVKPNRGSFRREGGHVCEKCIGVCARCSCVYSCDCLRKPACARACVLWSPRQPRCLVSIGSKKMVWKNMERYDSNSSHLALGETLAGRTFYGATGFNLTAVDRFRTPLPPRRV